MQNKQNDEVLKRYTGEGKASSWGSDKIVTELRKDQSRVFTEAILNLLTRRNYPKKLRVVSPSANDAQIETQLKKKLDHAGYQAQVIAADLVKNTRKPEAPPGILADAIRQPYADNSADILLDTAGAVWHNAKKILDTPNNTDPNACSELFKEYHRVLKPGGFLFMDDVPKFPLTSGFLLDAARGHKGKMTEIPGFAPPVTIGEGHHTLRVYQKLPTIK